MDYEYIKQAIAQLETTASKLKDLVETVPPERAKIHLVREMQAAIREALASLEAAIAPPNLEHLPPDVLERAEASGIPLGDIEVQVAIASHDLSQVMGILTEIENRAESIRRPREYFLVRLPDMPVERLGSRLPVYTAADFQQSKEPPTKEFRDRLKAKYGLDRLTGKSPRSRSTLFEKIKQAKQTLERPETPNPRSDKIETSPTVEAHNWELDEDIPF